MNHPHGPLGPELGRVGRVKPLGCETDDDLGADRLLRVRTSPRKLLSLKAWEHCHLGLEIPSPHSVW
jgi:hypothetical protein